MIANDRSSNKLVFKISKKGREYLQELCEKGELDDILGVHVEYVRTVSDSQSTLVRLGQLLQQKVAAITEKIAEIPAEWELRAQAIQTLPPWLKDRQLASASIRVPARDKRSSVQELIERLHATSDDSTRLETAKRIVEIERENSEGIDALVELVNRTEVDKPEYEETRWKAVECLAEFASNHLSDVVEIFQEIGLRLKSHPFMLSVAFKKISAAQVSVFIRLYCQDYEKTKTLPKGIKLIVLDELGDVFDEVVWEEEQHFYQYKVIYDLGESFGIRVTLGSDSITEYFVV
ncbi:MAG: DUF1822 family protein [Xenococcaceae cyanobacterium]